MELSIVFFIITAAILLLLGLLWLISRLTGSREDKENIRNIVPQDVNVVVKEPEAKTVVKAEKPIQSSLPETDDLQLIEGIGPKIEGTLNKSGITTFTQLAATQVIIIESILKEANLRIVNPSTWIDQAALAAEGKWDDLQNLKDQLQGGQKVN